MRRETRCDVDEARSDVRSVIFRETAFELRGRPVFLKLFRLESDSVSDFEISGGSGRVATQFLWSVEDSSVPDMQMSRLLLPIRLVGFDNEVRVGDEGLRVYLIRDEQ